MVFAFLENVLNLGIFTNAPVSHSKLQAELFDNLFPPTAERGKENYDLLYQNSIRKMNLTLSLRTSGVNWQVNFQMLQQPSNPT